MLLDTLNSKSLVVGSNRNNHLVILNLEILATNELPVLLDGCADPQSLPVDIELISPASDDLDALETVGRLNGCGELEGADGGGGEEGSKDKVSPWGDNDRLVVSCVEGTSNGVSSPAAT